jgi:general stress protein 26
MAQKTLHDIARAMREIDFTMLFTRSENGHLAGRPMSNNRDVDYTGDSYFFSGDGARAVADIARDPKVGLSLQGPASLSGAPPLFIAVEGAAELIRDKAAFAEHWNSDLDRWFEQGVDTPGLVLIRVRAQRVHYWDGEDEGEIAP